MENLSTITDIVKRVLEKNEQARNSDSFLYLQVLRNIAHRDSWKMPLQMMSVSYFLLHMKELGAPNFETVRRARQRIQAEYPELKACDAVQDARMDREADFRKFAKEVI